MTFSVISAFAVYFSILLAICIVAHKWTRTESDFVIGSRSLNFWLTAFSAHAADMSAWLFMAFPAAIFIGGMPQVWIALGLFVGMFLNWQFVAAPLRRQTEAFGSNTLPSFFSSRFGDQSKMLRCLTAAISIFFLIWYLSAGLIAMGYLFESMFGLDYLIGILIATVVAVIYTFSGGFITVAWTDMFQGCFLLVVILFVPIYALGFVGGIEEIQVAAATKGLSLSPLGDLSLGSLLTVVCLSLGWGLGYFGQPHIVTKFMGISSPEEVKKAKYVGMTWQFLALGASACVGLVGIAFFKEGLGNPELVFVNMVNQLFHPFLAAFVLCALLAANISTMDSQILVCASTLTEDLYQVFMKKKCSSKNLLRVSRFSVVLVAIVSFLLSMSRSSTVSGTVFYAWTGLGASFGPLLLMALYFPSTSLAGAYAGIIAGGGTAVAWGTIQPFLFDYPIPALIPSFFISIISILLFSKLFPNK